ncbi:MAG: cell division protein FtsZ [Candidatus Anstonellales archaeon]
MSENVEAIADKKDLNNDKKTLEAIKDQEVLPDDEELLKFIEQTRPKISVVGTGGSGSNTLTRLHSIGVDGVTLIAMNTDAQHLLKTKANRKVLLGKKLTRGMGAGSDPKIGEAAAQESIPDIENSIKGSAIVFVTCGLGGGTGTGSAHIIAETARKNDSLTISVVTLPFTSEGKVRMQNALDGLAKLKKASDSVVVIPNDKLLAIVPDLPLDTAFKVSDEILANAVKGIAELVTKEGLVNLDYADLRTILKNSGTAVVGMGEATLDVKAKDRALIAVESALNSPLLDVDISTANKALINVIGGEDMTLKEAELIVREVYNRIAPGAHIIWGARIEKNMPKTAIKVLVVLAGVKLPQYSVDMVTNIDLRNMDLDLLA